MRRWALVGAVAVIVGLSVRPVLAAGPPAVGEQPRPVANGATLSPADPVLTFHGDVSNPTPFPAVGNPTPAGCAAVDNCTEWALDVRTVDPFLVSIRTAKPGFDADDGFNLYVYDPAGKQVGSAAGVGSNGQAVAVTPDGNGVYTLVVTITYAYDNPVGYDGEARLMTGTSWSSPSPCGAPPCDLLPTLQSLPPSDFHVSGLPPAPSTPLGFPLPVQSPTPNSCYTEETVNDGATRCLRFTSDVRDTGYGPLQLQWDYVATGPGGAPQVGFAPGQCEAQQVVLRTDGSSTTRDAGPCEFHPQHGHFHYDDLVSFTLHAVNPDGSTGAVVAKGLKESFCLADDDYFGFATPGPNGANTFSGQPGCSAPSQITPPGGAGAGAWGLMGISPGWGDVYTWDTPDQFVDISNVPNGTYDVVSDVNPAGLLLTSTGTTGPCSSTRIALSSTAVSVVGTGLATSCP